MITFAVSDVSTPTIRLPSAGTADAEILRRIEGRVESAACNLPNLVRDRNALTEVSWSNRGATVHQEINPFVSAVHTAFAWHFPLTLSPDDIWLCIAQGFGAHVCQNAELLRDRFVQHAGREVIRVRRDDFEKGSPQNDWNGVLAEFSDEIAKHIGKRRDLVVADFSTTGIIERAASEIVLMSTMSRFFDFRLLSLCGIPRITLLGTPNDWKSMRTRAAVLAEYELEWWVEALLPVLDQLVATSNGQVDQKFWQSFYKMEDDSGGPYILGWLNMLFPYVRGSEGEDYSDPSKDTLVANRRYFERLKQGEPLMGGDERVFCANALTTDKFPIGLSSAPFIWEYFGTNIPMDFVAGFIGVSQDPETLAVRPAIGWAVKETGHSQGQASDC